MNRIQPANIETLLPSYLFLNRPSDTDMIERCERELQRIETEEIRTSLSTTQKAQELGITAQAVRDWAVAGKIPGARLIGQRWRFELPE